MVQIRVRVNPATHPEEVGSSMQSPFCLLQTRCGLTENGLECWSAHLLSLLWQGLHLPKLVPSYDVCIAILAVPLAGKPECCGAPQGCDGNEHALAVRTTVALFYHSVVLLCRGACAQQNKHITGTQTGHTARLVLIAAKDDASTVQADTLSHRNVCPYCHCDLPRDTKGLQGGLCTVDVMSVDVRTGCIWQVCALGIFGRGVC